MEKEQKATETTITVDVCIIGAAGSGLAAAVRAAESGAEKIAVLEKTGRPGGCTRLAMGVFAAESPVQKRKGITHTADECFRDHMQQAGWACDARLVRKWMTASGSVIGWLEGLGVEFDEVGTCSGTTNCYHMAHFRTGGAIVDALLKACQKHGVAILTRTRAAKLVTDDSGAVVGVLATRGNEVIKIRARCVVLATGSISGNKELVNRFFPDRGYDDVKIMAAFGFTTGDGLLMAEEVGAKIGNVVPLFIGPHNHPYNYRVGCLLRRPHLMIVNRDGQRYIDESIYGLHKFGWLSGMALDQQPGRICFPIMDGKIFRDMVADKECVNDVESFQSRVEAKTGLEDPDAGVVMSGTDPCAWLDMVKNDIPGEVDADRVKVADTLEEIAAWIGADPPLLITPLKAITVSIRASGVSVSITACRSSTGTSSRSRDFMRRVW